MMDETIDLKNEYDYLLKTLHCLGKVDAKRVVGVTEPMLVNDPRFDNVYEFQVAYETLSGDSRIVWITTEDFTI